MSRTPLERWVSQAVEARVAAALRTAGFSVDPQPSLSDGDLLIERGPLRLVAQIRVAREARRPVLEGLLADAVLRSRAAAHEFEGFRPLAVLGAVQLTD